FLQITWGLLLLAVCTCSSEKLKPKSADSEKNGNYSGKDLPQLHHHKKQLDGEVNLHSTVKLEPFRDKEFPILPPIILLDFVNGTDNNSLNKSDQGDDKLKRTIDDNLGYGFSSNSLFMGKHNFYFPAGSTGTAVSIDESVSPLKSETITEEIKPITEKTDANEEDDNAKAQKPFFEDLPDPLPLQYQEALPIYPPYPVYGQRTKLQKTPSSNFEKHSSAKLHQSSYLTPAPPIPSGHYKQLFSYAPHKSASHTDQSDPFFSANLNRYTRPMTSSYIANYMTGKYGSNALKSYANSNPNANSSPNSNQEINSPNYPKYTIENGVRYEHKTVWKYPDGKISEVPPLSHVNAYSENAGQQKLNQPPTIGGFRPSIPFHSPPTPTSQHASYSSYNTRSQNNIYSPRPVQFPNDQEQPSAKQQNEDSRFVSSSSADASYGPHFEIPSTYNVADQENYSLRYGPKPQVSYNNQFIKYDNHQPPVKYSLGGVKNEYTYDHQHIEKDNLFSSDGQINKSVLAKYTPEAQNYLTKVFSGKRTSPHEYQNEDAGNHVNTEFSNLLNYNPSLSQYIKNPSSILKAQPTFIQAGSSLIPVIILRVDGAPPIQTKTGLNINLKSLLRQYLTQYANSVSKVSQSTNYELGGASYDSEGSAHQTNPVEDLKQLTETLESLRQRGHQDPDFIVGNYGHSSVQSHVSHSNGALKDHAVSYSEYSQDYKKINSEPEVKKSQKVKSVQIVDDPRYTSYKINHNMRQ
ncbi:uncharacterized protein LOC106637396, partial [Copidosoma floridanum]|uniref:uncharacterized protein LOC106637396 n=1 Tax=Copidosoma floridanum TaxID=29053 RepID=UPI0006C94124